METIDSEKFMPTQITKWKTIDGLEFDNELDATRAENEHLVKCLEARTSELESIRSRENKVQSSYGSSGGGGHD